MEASKLGKNRAGPQSRVNNVAGTMTVKTAAGVHATTLELLNWVAARRRTYEETMEAWRTSCPRLSVWEDCQIEGLVCLEKDPQSGESLVALTALGRAIVD
jgi:hypothetical protein